MAPPEHHEAIREALGGPASWNSASPGKAVGSSSIRTESLPAGPGRTATMKLLLTGGAGYVGSACLRWLVRHGHDPIAYDDLCEGNAAAVPASRLVVGDILDTDRLTEAMRAHGVEGVMHFAAVASVPESIADPERCWRVNVAGTQSVLDAMRRAGVRRILFSSTAATYGSHTEMPLRRIHHRRPRRPTARPSWPRNG